MMVVRRILIAAYLKLLCPKHKQFFTNFSLLVDQYMFTRIVLRHPKMCVAVLNRFYDFLAFCTQCSKNNKLLPNHRAMHPQKKTKYIYNQRVKANSTHMKFLMHLFFIFHLTVTSSRSYRKQRKVSSLYLRAFLVLKVHFSPQLAAAI